MTTITIKEDVENVPEHFQNWAELEAYTLEKLRVQLKPLPESEITSDLLEKVNASRKKLHLSLKSFDNI